SRGVRSPEGRIRGVAPRTHGPSAGVLPRGGQPRAAARGHRRPARGRQPPGRMAARGARGPDALDAPRAPARTLPPVNVSRGGVTGIVMSLFFQAFPGFRPGLFLYYDSSNTPHFTFTSEPG